MFPYDRLPAHKNWRKAVAAAANGEIDPQHGAKFGITPAAKIASAGSCFAQRIAESLQTYGFSYYLAEPGPAWLTNAQLAEYGYGAYSARYGNIYTTLQLLQLVERATGAFVPLESVWHGRERGFFDPFRPSIQPGGFSSEAELTADRSAHLNAVKRMFEEIDVFIFTLGLTEGFVDARDGAAYPVCPGRDAGEFDPAKYVFRNLDAGANAEYLRQAIELLRTLNPQLRILLTISPVPLAATLEDRHVLAATVYSKSVLRVAAEEMTRRYDFVDYFASYEIVGATYETARYFAEDRRTVTAAGVDAVMRSFYRHYAGCEMTELTPVTREDRGEFTFEAKPCDEELLLRHISADLANAPG